MGRHDKEIPWLRDGDQLIHNLSVPELVAYLVSPGCDPLGDGSQVLPYRVDLVGERRRECQRIEHRGVRGRRVISGPIDHADKMNWRVGQGGHRFGCNEGTLGQVGTIEGYNNSLVHTSLQ